MQHKNPSISIVITITGINSENTPNLLSHNTLTYKCLKLENVIEKMAYNYSYLY